MAAGITMVEENHVESIEKPKLPMCKDFEQKFLDYFYQLAHGDADIRQTASVNVIRSVLSSRAPVCRLYELFSCSCSKTLILNVSGSPGFTACLHCWAVGARSGII